MQGFLCEHDQTPKPPAPEVTCTNKEGGQVTFGLIAWDL